MDFDPTGPGIESVSVGPVPVHIEDHSLDALSSDLRYAVLAASEGASMAALATQRVLAAHKAIALQETTAAQAEEDERFNKATAAAEEKRELITEQVGGERTTRITKAAQERDGYIQELEAWREEQIAEINRKFERNAGVAVNTFEGAVRTADMWRDTTIRAADTRYEVETATNEQAHAENMRPIEEKKAKIIAYNQFCKGVQGLLDGQMKHTKQELAAVARQLNQVQQFVEFHMAELGSRDAELEELKRDTIEAKDKWRAHTTEHAMLKGEIARITAASSRGLEEAQAEPRLEGEGINSVLGAYDTDAQQIYQLQRAQQGVSDTIHKLSVRIAGNKQAYLGCEAERQVILTALFGDPDTNTMGAQQRAQVLEAAVKRGRERLDELTAKFDAFENLVRDQAPLSQVKEQLGKELYDQALVIFHQKRQKAAVPTHEDAATAFPEGVSTQGKGFTDALRFVRQHFSDIGDVTYEAHRRGTLRAPAVEITVNRVEE